MTAPGGESIGGVRAFRGLSSMLAASSPSIPRLCPFTIVPSTWANVIFLARSSQQPARRASLCWRVWIRTAPRRPFTASTRIGSLWTGRDAPASRKGAIRPVSTVPTTRRSSLRSCARSLSATVRMALPITPGRGLGAITSAIAPGARTSFGARPARICPHRWIGTIRSIASGCAGAMPAASRTGSSITRSLGKLEVPIASGWGWSTATRSLRTFPSATSRLWASAH